MKRLTAFILLITILTLTGPGAQVRVWAEEKTSAQAAGTGEEAAVPGAELRMLANAQGSQMLGVVIYSEDGRTVVIDGGCDDDGDQPVETIKRNGGEVDAWLITHPHSDHVGALRNILQNRADEIRINKIYYSLAPGEWYEERGDNTAASLLAELSKLPRENICDTIGKGFEIEAGSIHITVLNDRYTMDSDPINNSSIVYLVKAGGQNIVFLGDMGYDGGYQLLRDAKGLLKADIVQMAHHGQKGVDKKVYEAIAPRICLWPTPQWLWDNDKGKGYNTGHWRTIETRKWMQSLGVAENYCTKDGEVVLQLTQ